MNEPTPPPDEESRPEPSLVFPLAMLGLVAGQLTGMFTRSYVPGCFPGALWGIILGLLARWFIRKDSRLAVVLQEAIRLLLMAAVAVYLVGSVVLIVGVCLGKI